MRLNRAQILTYNSLGVDKNGGLYEIIRDNYKLALSGSA